MSTGRWAKRGYAFRAWAFTPWALAGGSVAAGSVYTVRTVCIGTSLVRSVMIGTNP